MKELTNRQIQVLDFLQRYIQNHKYPPTVREVSEHFSVSVKAAHDHIKALEKKNKIRCSSNHSRAMEILDAPEETDEDRFVSVPLLGSVAAGRPLMAEENFEGSIRVQRTLLKKSNYFAVRVEGQSMLGAGILDGDIAVLRVQSSANSGDLVVVMLEDDRSYVLKRFFKEANRVRLVSENPHFTDIYASDVRILGKLAMVIRSYE